MLRSNIGLNVFFVFNVSVVVCIAYFLWHKDALQAFAREIAIGNDLLLKVIVAGKFHKMLWQPFTLAMGLDKVKKSRNT